MQQKGENDIEVCRPGMCLEVPGVGEIEFLGEGLYVFLKSQQMDVFMEYGDLDWESYRYLQDTLNDAVFRVTDVIKTLTGRPPLPIKTKGD